MRIEVVNKNDIRVLLYEKQEELLNRRNLPGELCLDGCCWLNTSDTIFLMAKKPTDKTLTLGDILSFLLTPSCSYLLANGLPLAISEKLITMKLDCSKTAFEFDRVKRKVTRATIVPILSHSSIFIEVGTVRIGITELKLKLDENYECSEKNIHLCGSFTVNGHQVTALSKVDIEGLPKLTLQFKECRDTATILNLLHAHETIVSKEVPLLKKRMNEVPVNAAEVTLLQPSRGSTLLTVQSIHFSTQPTSVFDCLKNYLPATINIVEVNSGSTGIVLGPQPTVCVSSKCTATTATGKQMLVLLNAETYTETGSDMTCSLEVKCMSKQSPLLSHDLDVVLKDSFGIVVENIPFLKSYSKHVQIYKVSLAYLVNTAKTLKKMSISAEISNFKIGPQIEFMGGPLRLDKSEDDIHLNCSGALQIGRYLTFASIQLPTSTTCGYLEVKNHDACFKLADVGTDFQVPEDFLQNISHLVNIKDKPVVKINCVLKMCENMLKITSTEMCLYATEEINFGNIFSLEKATLCLKIATIPAVEVAFTASGFFAITGECKQVMKRFGQWPRGDDIQEKSTNTGMFACVVYKGERVSVEMRAASFCVIDAIKCLEQLFQHGVHVATVGSIKEFIQNTKHIKSMLACAVSEKSSKMHKQGAMFNMRISFQMNVEQFKVVQRVKPDYVQFEMRDIIRLRHFVIDSYDFHYNSSIPDSTKFQIHAVLTKQNCDEGMDLLFKGDTTAITAQLLQRNTGNPLKLSSVLELALCGEPELPNIGIKIPDFIHLYLKKGEIKFSTKKPFEALAFNVTVIVPCWQLLSIPDISLREIEFTVIWEKGNKPELQLQALFCLAGVHLLFKGFISKANIRCSAKLSSEVSETELSAMNLTDIKNRLLQLQQPDLKNLDVQRTLQQLPHPTEGVRKLILHLPDFMRSITFKQLILQLEKEKKGLLCHAQLDASHKWTFPVGCYKLHMLSLGGVIEVWKCLVEPSTQYKACLYTQLKMCDLNIKVQVLLNSGGKNIITGYAEATQKIVPCSAILSEIPSCDGSTILGQLLPFKLSDNISEICMVVDITSKTLAILGNYEGLASCVLYLQLANGVGDDSEMQFVLGIDVPKGFKFGRICKELSFLDDKICVHQAGILIASLKSNTLTEVMEMFEKSVSIFNGVGTYTNTEVVEDNSEKSIEHLALDGIPNIHIPGPNHCETPLSVLNLRETGFFDYTFSKEFVLYGALDFANSHGYMQNTKTFAAKESHIPDLMLAMNVVIPASGDKDKYVRFHGRLNSDFNVINNITVKEATLDYWVQGEKQMVSLSGIVACDIPGCGTKAATNSKINAKGELHLWKSFALVHVKAFSSSSDTVISDSDCPTFNVNSGRLCELKLFMSTLPQQHTFFEMSIEAPLLSSLMKLRVLILQGNHVISLQLSKGVTLSDVFKLIHEDLSIGIFEDFTLLSGEIYFSAKDDDLPNFPSAPTDFIPPHLDNVQVVPKQHYCVGYHGIIKVRFFDMWTLELVVDITKSGKFEKISGRFPEPIKFLEIFGLVGVSGSETDTGPDITYKESENSLTMTCGLTVVDKRVVTGQLSIVHRHDFHGIEASLSLDFLAGWISNNKFSIQWSKQKGWQFKIPIFGSVPSNLFNFASLLKSLLIWVYKMWRMVTFGVNVWVTLGKNIDPKSYLVTFRIHGYFYVEFVGLIKIPAIALPEEGIPIVIEKVNLKTFKLSDIPGLVVKNLKTNAKLIVSYLWDCIKNGDILKHMCYTVKLAVNSVLDKAKGFVSIVKKGLSAIKTVFSLCFGCVKVRYEEREIGEILGGKKCQEFKHEEKITRVFGELAMLLGIAKISKEMHRSGKAHLAIPEEVSHLPIHENDGQSVSQLKISANELAVTVANTVADKLCIQNIKVQINSCITVKWSVEDEVFECDHGDIEYEVILYITSLNEASTKLLTLPVIGPKPVSYKLNASGKLKKLEDQYFLSIPDPFEASHPTLYVSISIRASVTMTVRSLMEELKYDRRVSVTLKGNWHHVQQQICKEDVLLTEEETVCAVKCVTFDSENMTITPTVDESICSNDNLNFVQVVDKNNTSIVLVRTALQTTSPVLQLNEIPCESQGPYQVQIVSITSENRMVLHLSDEVVHRNPHPHDVQIILPDRLKQGADECTQAKWKIGQSELDHSSPQVCSHGSSTVVDSSETITCSYTLCCKQTLKRSGENITLKHTLITAERVTADDNNDFKIDFNLQDAVMNHKCSKACDRTMFDKTKSLILQPLVFTDGAKHFLHSKPVKGSPLYVFSPPKEIKLFCPSKKADIEVWLKYADESLSYQVEVIDKHGSIVQGPFIYHHKEFIRNSPRKKLQEDCDDNLKEVWDSKHVLKIHKVCACLKEYTEYKFQVFSVGYGDQYLMSIVPQVAPQTIQLLPVTVDYDPERVEIRVNFETNRYKAVSYTVELFVFTESVEQCLVSMKTTSSPCLLPLHQYRIIPAGLIRALVRGDTSESIPQLAQTYLIGISKEELSVMPHPQCTYDFSYMPAFQNYLLEKVDLQWHTSDDNPEHFFGITDYDSNEILYKEKNLNGHGVVRFFSDALSDLLPQLANVPMQFSCFVQSIATPKRVNSNPQKSLPLQCLQSKFMECENFIVFFSFHLNNLRNYHAEMQTLRCFIPTNALPQFLLVVLPTTSTGTVPELPEACESKLVNLFHRGENGKLLHLILLS